VAGARGDRWPGGGDRWATAREGLEEGHSGVGITTRAHRWGVLAVETHWVGLKSYPKGI